MKLQGREVTSECIHAFQKVFVVTLPSKHNVFHVRVGMGIVAVGEYNKSSVCRINNVINARVKLQINTYTIPN